MSKPLKVKNKQKKAPVKCTSLPGIKGVNDKAVATKAHE